MSLNLKALDAEAHRDGTMMSDDFLAVLRALRETRTALNDLLRAPFVNIDKIDEQSFTAEERRAREVLRSVSDD